MEKFCNQIQLRLLTLAAALTAGAFTPLVGMETLTVEELAGRMVANEELFVIDARLSHQYEAGHIPGAVNIPVRQLPSRRLPPLGEVIVYGDGLGKIDIAEAVALLAEKDGLEPIALDGGYAAWQTRSGVTTEAPGFRKALDPTITYHELKANKGRGVVVYDLRQGSGEASDLKEHFPQARVVRGNPHERLHEREGAQPQTQLQARGEGNPLLRTAAPDPVELVVLIDDDQKSATAAARRLRAGGLRRVAVLAGGELSVRTEGRAGKERRNQTIVVSGEAATDNAEESQP